MENSIQQTLQVNFAFPVVFSRGIFRKENSLLAETLGKPDHERKHRLLVIMDQGAGGVKQVRDYVAHFSDRLEWTGEALVLPGGEDIKNDFSVLTTLVESLVRAKLCRHSFVLAIGGGALLDTAGLAAALVHRGLRLIRVPTTVLAQCDSGVGVKNGINFAGQKNLLGTFAPPFAVLNDFDFLKTLPQDAWIGGIAEAFKVAIIKDAAFFDFLCESAERLRDRDEEVMEKVIRRCAELHLEHIRKGGDPFENGTARPLDFGHWSAHELERETGWALGHGQAVAMGVNLDSAYAFRKGWLNEDELRRIRRGLTDCGFSLSHPVMAARDEGKKLSLLQGLENFREHLGGLLSITFPRGLGHSFEAHEIDLVLMETCVQEALAYDS